MSPAKKRRAKKKPVRKKAAARKKTPAKRRAATKRAPVRKKKAVAKRVAKRPPARKKAAAKKRPAAKRTARVKAPVQPAFAQRETASAKQLVLFELFRARTTFQSAIQGLGSSANDPIAPGKWSPREIVLHLVSRDQARLRELEAALRGATPSWKNAKQEDWATINEANLEPLRHYDWEDALRLLHRTRQQLIEEIESIPEEPASVWSPEHPLGWMLSVLPPHDRHHADQIKQWRATRGA